MIVLRDCETHERVFLPDDTVCSACGRFHDPSSKGTRLVIDHDRWYSANGKFNSRILCQSCNGKKGAKRFVSFGEGRMWVPGMNPGETITNIFSVRTLDALDDEAVKLLIRSSTSYRKALSMVDSKERRHPSEPWYLFTRRTGLTMGMLNLSERLNRRVVGMG